MHPKNTIGVVPAQESNSVDATNALERKAAENESLATALVEIYFEKLGKMFPGHWDQAQQLHRELTLLAAAEARARPGKLFGEILYMIKALGR